ISCPANHPWPVSTGRNIDYGTGFDDIICPLEGNDDLWGRKGGDSLVGDPGRDLMLGEDGADRLYGGANYAGMNPDRLLGGSGDDYLYARGDYARDCVWGGTYAADAGVKDHGRLDLGRNTWSDNYGSAPT